jgi:hypothetical protein
MNIQDAERFFRFLSHEKLTELRVIDPNDGIVRQVFVDELEDFLAVCKQFDGRYNIYVGVNERESKGGKAENVSRVSIIPIDIDPVRAKGQASTDEELKLARRKMEEIKSWLKTRFGCSPFVTMSGNGYHIFIKIPPINLDEFSRGVVEEKLKQFIHAIQDEFNDEQVHIDSTFDLPRVMKCLGTLSVKGNDTKERPWRRCKIIEPNDKPCLKVREYLASLKPPQRTIAEYQLGDKTREDFEALLEKDKKLRDLYEGHWEKHKFKSRSEAEESLLTILVSYGFSKDAIYGIMNECKIGKWQEKGDAYRATSLKRAIEFLEKQKPKKSKQKLEQSVGGILEDGLMYEQVAGEKFTVYQNGKAKYAKQIKNFVPYKKLPWALPSKAEPYESEEALYQDVRRCIGEHLDLREEEAYDVLAGWVLSSWLIEKWRTVPYLQLFGPFESGKTRALEILAELTYRGWLAAYTTAANIYRIVEDWHPTLFLDEAEVYGDRNEITALLNAGYRRGQLVPRQVKTDEGKFETELYDVFSLKALASTKTFKRTLVSRCITFRMTQKTREVKLLIDEEQTRKLRNQLLAFRFQNSNRELEEKMPLEELARNLKSPRLAELFYPLVTVAPTSETTQKIISYAKQMQRSRIEELALSEEARVLSAILCCYDSAEIKNGKISVQNVKDALNETLDPHEWRDSRHVGKIISKLGFDRCRVDDGYAGFYYDQKLIERFKFDPRYKGAFKGRKMRAEAHQERKNVHGIFKQQG